MTIAITITSDGYKKIKKLATKIKFEKYNEQLVSHQIIINEDIRDVYTLLHHVNYLSFDYGSEIFELLKDICDDVNELYFSGIADINYGVICNESLSNIQNINLVHTKNRDVFSIENNKLLFYSRCSYIHSDLWNGKSSLKSLFDKTNFEIIEYATIEVDSILKENYYYSLKWIGKMCNLKRLNLILNFSSKNENEDEEQFINEMNIPTSLEILVIKSNNSVELNKIKIPFGTKIDLFYINFNI